MKTKRLVVLVISLLILGSCSSNDDNSVTENQPTLVHKWSLNGWKFNNVVQTLTNCKKQSYIQFNSNNTFERKDYAFVSNNCVLEGSDNGTYNYNSSTHKITLNFTDPNNGSQVEVLNNVNFTNTNLTYTWDEDNNGVDEHSLDYLKN